MTKIVTFSDAEGHSDHSIGSRHAVQAADEVGEVVEHRQIVLHHDDVAVGPEQAADRLGSLQTLLYVQVGRGLIEHEAVEIYVFLFK